MLGEFFKKKENPPTPPATVQPPPIEVGKEVYSKDPKTGQAVYHRAMSAENQQVYMNVIQKNINLAQQFLVASRNFSNYLEQVMVINKGINESEKEIGVTKIKIRDEMKIDNRWDVNMNLGVWERRDPPNG